MKVKFLIAALFFSLVAAAQPSNYIKFNTRGRWIAGMFDSTLHVPRFNGSPSLRTGGSSMDGAIAIDTTNGIFYFYQGGSWKRANLDTSAYAVTSVYRKTASDSVFYVKGGVHTFAFKDSTGGGTPTLQQVLTAGSTLTGGNTIDADGNDFSIDNIGEFLQIRSTYNGVHSIFINESLNFGSTLNGKNSSIDILPISITIRPSLDSLFIDSLAYTLSTTGKKILIRDTATGLVQNIDPSLLGASSYTFTNGLTNSSGTVKLGGTTLTEAVTTLDGGTTNTLRFQDMLFEVTNSNILMLGDSISLTGGATPNRKSDIKLKNDTIKINPGIGLLYIDTLTSAVGTKALRYNPTTGLVSYADTTTGGSGGTPAGSTKQIQYNNAGSFGGAAGFEYQAAASPNILMKGQDKTYIPLIVKGVDSSQTADLFRVSRYEDSAMFRVAANGSVTIGPAYDYANAIHAPGHEFRYSNAGYTGGIKIRNHNSGSIVRLQTVNNGLYLTDDGGSAAAMTLGTRTNPADASTFIAASGVWTISAGRFGVGGTADASAIIAATSTTKGFLPPKMTGTQAEAITSPAEGLMVYATDGSGTTITSKGWWGYDGSVWTKLN